MLEQLKYVNHFGEVVEFGKNGLFVNQNDLRDYEWTYDSDRSRAENFRKGVVSKTIPVVISADSKKKCVDIKNQMYEIFESDIITGQHGKIYVGDYYLECYIYSSVKSNYLDTATTINISLKLVSDDGIWKCVQLNRFRYAPDIDVDGKGYEYEYEYDYRSIAEHISSLNNQDFKDSNFRLIIYGPVVNPSVYIDMHRYNVDCVVDAGEQLIIDTRNYTVNIRTENGLARNMFRYRNRECDVFKRLASGKHIVVWNSDFDFDIRIYHERGEPRWI